MLPLYPPSFLPQVPCLEPHIICFSHLFPLLEAVYECLRSFLLIPWRFWCTDHWHSLQHFFSPTFCWFPYTCRWSLHHTVLSVLWNTYSNLCCPFHGSTFTLITAVFIISNILVSERHLSFFSFFLVLRFLKYFDTPGTTNPLSHHFSYVPYLSQSLHI